jgi:hypothetical protein
MCDANLSDLPECESSPRCAGCERLRAARKGRSTSAGKSLTTRNPRGLVSKDDLSESVLLEGSEAPVERLHKKTITVPLRLTASHPNPQYRNDVNIALTRGEMLYCGAQPTHPCPCTIMQLPLGDGA